MRFKLVQRKDENGDLLNEADVYVCTGKDWLIFDHWTLMEDGMGGHAGCTQPRYPGHAVPDTHTDTGAAGQHTGTYAQTGCKSAPDRR